MQIKHLRLKAYRSWVVDDTTPPQAAQRLRKLDVYASLRAEGCSESTALEAIGWSRATYYRWRKRFEQAGLKGLVAGSRRAHRPRQPQWTRHHEQLVWQLRRRFPTWGKRPIWRVLQRDYGVELSLSTVGRILAKGIRLGRIRSVSFVYGRLKPVKRRRFQHHAKRWRYGMNATRAGQLIQIDHMSVYLPDVSHVLSQDKPLAGTFRFLYGETSQVLFWVSRGIC